MATRPLAVTIQSVTRTPREGLRVDFLPEAPGYDPVSVRTDASGVFVATLETGVPYSTAFIGPIVIDGDEMSGSVTVIYLTVPEGEGPATLAESQTQLLSTGWSVLLRRLVTLEMWKAAAEPELAALQSWKNAAEVRLAALEGGA